MLALITGGSSGIGRDIAYACARRGIDVILVGRNEKKLRQVTARLSKKADAAYVVCDLREEAACRKLYEQLRYKGIDILVNNAGFGDCGDFHTTDLDKDLDMIRTNIMALHILTKLFLKDFVARDHGHILNVASSASFFAGPEMATYYATKNYVYRLSEAIWEELRHLKSRVRISILCPGPVDTDFNRIANVKFSMPGMDSRKVAECAVKGMLKGKLLIIPGIAMNCTRLLGRLAPDKVMLRFCYRAQHSKLER